MVPAVPLGILRTAAARRILGLPRRYASVAPCSAGGRGSMLPGVSGGCDLFRGEGRTGIGDAAPKTRQVQRIGRAERAAVTDVVERQTVAHRLASVFGAETDRGSADTEPVVRRRGK